MKERDEAHTSCLATCKSLSVSLSFPTKVLYFVVGTKTVSFDVLIVSMKDIEGADITAPKMIYYQALPGTGTDYGAFWDNSVRLTPRTGNDGYQTITKVTDGSTIAWDSEFELNTWYTVTLTLKSEVQLMQVVNNGNGCSFEMLYRNFTFA